MINIKKNKKMIKTFDEFLRGVNLDSVNESKISFESMNFTLVVSNDKRGVSVQFIPDSKTIEYSKNEQFEAISKLIEKKMPEFSDLFSYEIGKPSAGISFRLNVYELSDILAKKLK